MQLPATLTLAQATAAAAALEPAAAAVTSTSAAGVTPSAEFTVDASALREFDTSALSVLLQAHRVAQARGLKLKIAGAPPKLHQLAQLYGVASLLGLEEGQPDVPSPSTAAAQAQAA